VDLIAAIAAQGYAGVIPLNFAAGTGHGSEAKVLLPISGNDGDEIEALTAKPIDAASDSAFLAIGSRLGEAIDGGEIATGLLVHWPGQGCDSFHDLRRLASWSLSLGRFWKISDYFSSGQRPYHRGNLSAIASDPASIDNILFSDDMADPITATGEALVQSALDRRDRVLTAISGLLNPSNNSGSTASNRTIDDSMKSIANSAGMTWDPDGDGKMVVNANSIPLRVAAEIRGTPAAMKHVYSCDRDQDRYLANLDVPALGYAIVRPAAAGEKSCASGSRSAGIGGWIRNQFLGRGPSIAEGVRLHNEFMEVEISDQFGGVAGVYSGGARGNRFSMRLVAETESSGSESTIRCDDVLVTKSTAAVGQIEAKGRLLVEGSEIATFVNRYSLASGSRMLTVHVELKKSKDLDMNDWQADRWKNYIAARVAVPEESSVCGALIRDKVHRSRGRRIVAPLGLVVDEGERQTLITSDGYPLHRRVGKRFYDTLLMVRGQSNHSFNLRYGFDVAQPVATAWSGLAAARQLAFRVNPGVNPQANSSGWFAHVGPREVLISDMQFHQLEPHQEFSSPQHVSGNEGVAEEYSDQTIGLEIELIATRGKSCTASLRFFRQPVSAYRLAGKPPFESNAGQPLELKNDAIRIPLNGHEACRIMVVFDDSHRKESK
jgi:alpha-mannosidase